MAEDFSRLLADIKRILPESRIDPVPEATLTAIRQRHPDVPEHYINFLRNVGFGRFGDGNFMIYNGLGTPDEIYDPETAEELEGILFFGDDFGGWNAGFDTRSDWIIVGVSSSDPEPYPEQAQTLAEFVARWIERFE